MISNIDLDYISILVDFSVTPTLYDLCILEKNNVEISFSRMNEMYNSFKNIIKMEL